MDVQLILAVNLMALSAMAIFASLIHMRFADTIAWLVINGMVLVVGAAALQWRTEWAGWIVAAVFLPFVLAPVLLGNLARRAASRNKLAEAAAYLRVAAALHPTSRLRFNAALTRAQAHPTEAETIAALKELGRTATPAQQALLRASEFRIRDDWEGLLRDVRQHKAASQTAGFDTMPLRIRALGETGRTDDMVRLYDEARPQLSPQDQRDCQLFVLAFCGRVDEVRQLFAHALAGLDEEAKRYWIAIASRAAGAEDGVWQSPLRALTDTSANASIRRRAARQLAAGRDVTPEPLSGAARAIVNSVAARVQRPTTEGGPRVAATPVTYALLGLIAVGYALELYHGGAENLRTLVDLGAMRPDYVLGRGEWWRLATALFLHFGPLHLGLNAFMLYVLGRGTEMAIGSARTLMIYGLSGLASSGFVLWAMTNGYARPAVLMGASGAILALFGALLARRLVTWARTRDIQDRRDITMLAVIIAMQVAIDLSLPQISFAAHASGFVAGLVISLALELFDSQRRGWR